MAARSCPVGNNRAGREVTDVSASVPDSAQFTITPTVTHASITSDRTGQIELAVTWNGDDPTQFKFGNETPFSYPQYSADSSGLLLLPAEAGIERRDKQTWMPKTGEGGLGAPMVTREPELNPDETVTGTWDVWGDPEHVSFIEPGTYHFESSLLVGTNNEPISWTLAVTIEAGSGSN